jgi:hypothetical protein
LVRIYLGRCLKENVLFPIGSKNEKIPSYNCKHPQTKYKTSRVHKRKQEANKNKVNDKAGELTELRSINSKSK